MANLVDALQVMLSTVRPDLPPTKVRSAMKKSKLTLLFVLYLASFVPQIVSGQASPDAKVETNASQSVQTGKKMRSAKATGPIQLAADAPGTYIVVKGDTLWDISGRFLNRATTMDCRWHQMST